LWRQLWRLLRLWLRLRLLLPAEPARPFERLLQCLRQLLRLLWLWWLWLRLRLRLPPDPARSHRRLPQCLWQLRLLRLQLLRLHIVRLILLRLVLLRALIPAVDADTNGLPGASCSPLADRFFSPRYLRSLGNTTLRHQPTPGPAAGPLVGKNFFRRRPQIHELCFQTGVKLGQGGGWQRKSGTERKWVA
jgi:hypothetical protein